MAVCEASDAGVTSRSRRGRPCPGGPPLSVAVNFQAVAPPSEARSLALESRNGFTVIRCNTESLVPIHAAPSESAAIPKKRRRSCRGCANIHLVRTVFKLSSLASRLYADAAARATTDGRAPAAKGSWAGDRREQCGADVEVLRRSGALSKGRDCDRTVIRQAQNPDDHGGLPTHTE